jgi:hypothetical protein
VNQGLLNRDAKPDGTTYWKTLTLEKLSPRILKVGLPSVDALVEEYNKQGWPPAAQEAGEWSNTFPYLTT